MGIAKILVNFSIATIAWWARRLRHRLRWRGLARRRHRASSPSFGNSIGGLAGDLYGDTFGGGDRRVLHLPVHVLRGLAGDRVGHDARAHEVRRVHPVRDRLRRRSSTRSSPTGASAAACSPSIGNGVQDFAGSSVVHLTGATAALAALIFLGPRKGKYGPDGKPRAIPGHNMPLFGLGVLILWLGWFGFNGASTLGTADGRFAEVVAVTNLGAAGGVIGALLLTQLVLKTLDVGMIGNGAIAGLVAITAPSGYVEFWAAPIIGFIGGVHRRRRRADVRPPAPRRPGRRAVGARPGRHLGHARVRPVHLRPPRRGRRRRRARACSTAAGSTSSASQAAAVGADVRRGVRRSRRSRSSIIKATIGLRVADEDEDRRPRHRRARHVRLPRAVHPAVRAGGVRCGSRGPSG